MNDSNSQTASYLLGATIATGMCIGVAFSLKLYGFFTEKKIVNQGIIDTTKAYEEYTTCVNGQNDQLKIMQEILMKCINEGDSIINEQNQKLNELKLKLPTQHSQKIDNSTQQENQTNEQTLLNKLKIMFIEYPKLPTCQQTATEIKAIQNDREDHHNQVYTTLTQYLNIRTEKLRLLSSSDDKQTNLMSLKK